jgi:intein/homing endonuclease
MNTQIKKGDYVLIPRGKEFFGDDYIIQPEEVEEVKEDGSIRAYGANLKVGEFELVPNNTQIETVEEAFENYANKKWEGSFPMKVEDCVKKAYLAGINWKKQQDEAKYKELLDSHNELLAVVR